MLSGDKSLYGEYEHVYTEDPCIDTEHADYNPKRYSETGDRKWLPVKNGESPAVFRLEHLTGKARQYVIDQFNRGQMVGCYEAIALALTKVDNVQLDGEEIEFERTPTSLGQRRVPEAKMADLEAACGPHWKTIVSEVGNRIMTEALGLGK